MIRAFMRASALALLASGMMAGAALAKDPVAPAGTDPGGTAIAVIAPGFDYTRTEIAERLARDGEGLPIGWDVIDGDVTPYAAEAGTAAGSLGHSTLKAIVNGHPKGRLVLVRANLGDPKSLSQALGFVVRTPATVVAIPTLPDGAGVGLITAIAARAPKVLFIVPGQDGWNDPAPENLIRAAPLSIYDRHHDRAIDFWFEDRYVEYPGMMDDPVRRQHAIAEAVAQAAGAAGCVQHDAPAATGADAKVRTLDALVTSWTRSRVKVWLGQCHYRSGKL